MQEYLTKQSDGTYKLTFGGGDIEIPKGAVIYVYFNEFDRHNFYKDGFSEIWQNDGYWDSDMSDYIEYCKKEAIILWQRPTKPEVLPFIDDNPQSLNEQYAEIEQVRQAVKVKSGSDSDHVADAMAYGFMGAKQALQHKHYFKDVSNLDEIDVYMVLKLFNVTDPCLQHIVKKALCAGQRGHKDLERDLKDILDTAKRAVDINKTY